MEGPSVRSFPRMDLRNAVELRAGSKTIRVEKAVGNLSVGGLYVNAENLPLEASVHVKIVARHPFEAEGVVRESHAGGVGIEFTSISEANRKRLDELIAELLKREVLAS